MPDVGTVLDGTYVGCDGGFGSGPCNSHALRIVRAFCVDDGPHEQVFLLGLEVHNLLQIGRVDRIRAEYNRELPHSSHRATSMRMASRAARAVCNRSADGRCVIVAFRTTNAARAAASTAFRASSSLPAAPISAARSWQSSP